MLQKAIIAVQKSASVNCVLNTQRKCAGGHVETPENYIQRTTDSRGVLLEQLLKEHTNQKHGSAQKENGHALKIFRVLLLSESAGKEKIGQRIDYQHRRDIKCGLHGERQAAVKNIARELARAKGTMLREAGADRTKSRAAKGYLEDKQHGTDTDEIQGDIFQAFRPCVEIGNRVPDERIYEQNTQTSQNPQYVKAALFERKGEQRKGEKQFENKAVVDKKFVHISCPFPANPQVRS